MSLYQKPNSLCEALAPRITGRMTEAKSKKDPFADVRDENGELPHHAWPGGYPIMYHDKEGSVLCPECANKSDKNPDELPNFKPHGHFVHYEGPPEHCENCNKEVASAYGDPNHSEESAVTEGDPPVAKTTIRKNEWGEHHVRAYDAKGKRIPNSDAFESDHKAAAATAAAMVKHSETRGRGK